MSLAFQKIETDETAKKTNEMTGDELGDAAIRLKRVQTDDKGISLLLKQSEMGQYW